MVELEKLRNISITDFAKFRRYKIIRCGSNTYRVNPCPICGSDDHLTLYDKTNSFYSFAACCKGGSVIDFVMQTENISFSEAVKILSDFLAGGKNARDNRNTKNY